MTNVAYWNLIAVHRWLDARQPLFSIVKYSIFALLAVTSFFYIRDGIRAAQQTLDAQSTFWDVLTMYAISVDYIAWLSLLALFELETSVVDGQALRRGWKWLFHGLSALCYVAVFYALVGYLAKLGMILDFSPLLEGDLCNWPEPLTLMAALDAFVPVMADNCATLNEAMARGQLNLLNAQPIVFEASTYWGIGGSWSIAWSDAIEAVLWIAVMALIQLEIVL